MGRILTRWTETDMLRSGLNLEVETERLVALIDGLSLNAALRPDILHAAQSESVLRTHLASLCTQ